LPEKLTDKIEKYFKYRWEKHKSQGVIEDYQQLLRLLPGKVQGYIFIDYLYSQFLYIHKPTFSAVSAH